MKLLKKITAKTVLGKTPTAALLGDKDHIDIMTVFGEARERKDGVHTFGDSGKTSEYVKFKGDIRVVRISDGVEFRAGECILPGVAEGVLDAVLSTEGTEAVRFAFLIGLQKDDSAARGYVLTAEPLIESKETDPLADMVAQLSSKGTPGLPAPENVTKIDTGKAEPTEPSETEPAKVPPKKAAAKK
jgi:hypothetical protein